MRPVKKRISLSEAEYESLAAEARRRGASMEKIAKERILQGIDAKCILQAERAIEITRQELGREPTWRELLNLARDGKFQFLEKEH
jgi:hypothetical protein